MKNNFDLKKFLTENKLTSNSSNINEDNDLINKIRSGVSGKEADSIFKAAQGYLKDGDAEDMVDALGQAADEYYEFYEREDNEDGTEVAKYIMRSLPKKDNISKVDGVPIDQRYAKYRLSETKTPLSKG